MKDNRLSRLDQDYIDCIRVNYNLEIVEQQYGRDSYVAAACRGIRALTFEVEDLWKEIERLRGAIDWCIEEGAVLDFFTLQLFHPRVGIKIGGHPPGEYDTFLEAAEGYQKVVEWRRTSLASPRNSLEPPLGDTEER